MEEVNWSQYFYYDETSPSCLRWQYQPRRAGSGGAKCEHAQGSVVGWLGSTGYYEMVVEGKCRKAHRIIAAMHGLDLLERKEVDHIDRVRSNNKITNLRTVSRTLNMRNRGKSATNKSGTRGVSLCVFKRGDKSYANYVAHWRDASGKDRNKKFAIIKYGEEAAKQLAIDWRVKEVSKIEGYSNVQEGQYEKY